MSVNDRVVHLPAGLRGFVVDVDLADGMVKVIYDCNPPEGGDGDVYSLEQCGRGLAAILDSEGLGFAKQLQMAHDCGQYGDTSPLGVRNAFMALGQECDLVWPEGC